MAGIAQFQSLDFIRNEVHSLRSQWVAFRRLSVQGDNDNGVLGESAPEFFFVVQRALISDVALTICRLFDRANNAETLKSALNTAKKHIHDATFEQLTQSLDKIDQEVTAANLGDARNQVIAHSNRDVTRGRSRALSSGLPAIGDIVQSISDWVIELHGAVGFECKFDETELHSSVDGLVNRLRGG